MGHIYFIQVGNDGDIKIGYSTNIKSRMSTLQTSIPVTIKLLGYICGDITIEKELHKKFRIFKVKGEWFKCTKDIIDFINENNEMTLQANLKTYIELDENNRTTIYGKISMK